MSQRFPIPDAAIDAVALELYRLTLALATDPVPLPLIGRWDRDTGLRQRYRQAATSVLNTAARQALILPPPAEVRAEWGIWWHAGNPDGIALSECHFGSRGRAVTRAESRIGEYGITSYTIVRRDHYIWDTGNLASLSTDWRKDPATD